MPNSPSVKKSLLLITLLAAIYSASGQALAFYADQWRANPDSSYARRPSSFIQVALSALQTTTSWDQREPDQTRFELPLLFLHREQDAAAETDRTLEVTLSGLPASAEIQLELISHHVNIATGVPHTVTGRFALPGRPCTPSNPCKILWILDATTLSDLYYLRVKDAAGDTLWEHSHPNRPDLAVLDTWDVPLGQHVVRVTYATLFPFAKGQDDLENRLSPDGVRDFVAATFVPIIEETWRTQVDAWRFGEPIHPGWDTDNLVEIFVTAPPFALFGGTGTYSVSTVGGQPYPERRIWWFSSSESFQAYDSLENAYKVVFAHEFFHLMQWNVLLNAGHPTNRWHNLFMEAQAKFAASVQYPGIELGREHLDEYASEYSGAANRFLDQRLKISYRDLEADKTNRYDAALYWRFLYDQYNDMGIIRAALEAMVRHYSPHIIQSMHRAMDAAFGRFAGPFRTYEESLIAFSRANYALRLENGRCTAADLSDCGGLYHDPLTVYLAPPLAAELKYDGDRLYDIEAGYALSLGDPAVCAAGGVVDSAACADAVSSPLDASKHIPAHTETTEGPLTYRGSIPASYGMDFVEIDLARSVQGQPMIVTFESTGALSRFNVELWMLGPGATAPRPLTSEPDTLSHSTLCNLPPTADRLALIITRVDPHETTDRIGRYTITLESGAGPDTEFATQRSASWCRSW